MNRTLIAVVVVLFAASFYYSYKVNQDMQGNRKIVHTLNKHHNTTVNKDNPIPTIILGILTFLIVFLTIFARIRLNRQIKKKKFNNKEGKQGGQRKRLYR